MDDDQRTVLFEERVRLGERRLQRLPAGRVEDVRGRGVRVRRREQQIGAGDR
ncbi:hypothetical protein ACWV95_24260 [Streptomyces albus]